MLMLIPPGYFASCMSDGLDLPNVSVSMLLSNDMWYDSVMNTSVSLYIIFRQSVFAFVSLPICHISTTSVGLSARGSCTRTNGPVCPNLSTTRHCNPTGCWPLAEGLPLWPDLSSYRCWQWQGVLERPKRTPVFSTYVVFNCLRCPQVLVFLCGGLSLSAAWPLNVGQGLAASRRHGVLCWMLGKVWRNRMFHRLCRLCRQQVAACSASSSLCSHWSVVGDRGRQNGPSGEWMTFLSSRHCWNDL